MSAAHERCQPKPAEPRRDPPVCVHCDNDLSCGACGMEQPYDDISLLKAELAEWKQAASVEADLRREFLARAEQAERRVEELERRERWLIDWVYLYATEGHSWISKKTSDKLIALSSRAPTQADADHLKTEPLATLSKQEGA